MIFFHIQPISSSALGASDVEMLARALYAVASSETMTDWPAYRAEVERSRRRTASDRLLDGHGDEQAPERIVGDLAKLVACATRCGGTNLTWSAQPVLAARVVAALASFVDDYEGSFPSELFPEREVTALLQTLRGRPAASLTAAGQLRCALGVASEPFSAIVLLHATLRLLARGRDFRAYPNTRRMSVSERLALGDCVAPFRPRESKGGDPLGDAYHYWAMVTAGMFRPRIASRTGRATFGALFWSAPWLMSGVRGGLFGRILFYGNHATVDRLGLAHGGRLSPANEEFARLCLEFCNQGVHSPFPYDM